MKNRPYAALIIILLSFVFPLLLSGCTPRYEDLSGYPDLLQSAAAQGGSAGDGNGLKGMGTWSARNTKPQYTDFCWDTPQTFNTVVLKEVNSNVRKFSLYSKQNGEWQLFYRNDKIEDYRYCTFNDVTAAEIRLEVSEAVSKFKIDTMQVFCLPKTQKSFRVNDYAAVESPTIFTDMLTDRGQIDLLDGVTDITFMAGLGILPNGEISYYPDNPVQEGNPSSLLQRELSAFRQLIGDRDIDVYLNLYSNNEDISDALDKYSDKLIAQYLTLAQTYSLAGFDIDWEYPQTKKQWKSFGDFIIKLKAACLPHNLRVMIATSGWGASSLSAEAIQAIDYCNAMIYDMRDADGYHSSFQHFLQSAKQFTDAGFTKEQLLLGLPFYGRDTLTGQNLVNYRDIASDDPWSNIEYRTFTDKNGELQSLDFFYNGYAMIRDKTAYAFDFGYGGVMTWQYISDRPATKNYNLHQAMQSVITQRTP